MDENKFIMVVAVIALGVAVIGAGVTYFTIADLVTRMTGHVSAATANLTIESYAAINFTTDVISWGSGRIYSDKSSANLNTLETGNVSGGNWTLAKAGGLRIENIGNVNVSLNLTAGKSAASFIGGTSPVYEWNISASEANSCFEAGAVYGDLSNWNDTTTAEFVGCPIFRFETARDEVRIDLNLTILEDSKVGELTDTITAVVVIAVD